MLSHYKVDFAKKKKNSCISVLYLNLSQLQTMEAQPEDAMTTTSLFEML